MSSPSEAVASGALAGIVVVDLTRILAGPWCTQLLGDYGAEVIKIERPDHGDDTRSWGPPWLVPDDGDDDGRRDAAYFGAANRNKKSVTADIASPEGQALVRRLVEEADVLVENFKVGDLARYGLDFAALSRVNPRLVYCSITGYGQTGPYADRPGYDFVFQAEAGLMSVTGERDDRPGGGPQKVGVAVADLVSGMYACTAILAALEHRHRTGEGQAIDVALFDCTLSFGANLAFNHVVAGSVPGRFGNGHPVLVPYQVFRTADGAIVVAAGNDGQWKRLCAAVDRPDLAGDARFAPAPVASRIATRSSRRSRRKLPITGSVGSRRKASRTAASTTTGRRSRIRRPVIAGCASTCRPATVAPCPVSRIRCASRGAPSPIARRRRRSGSTPTRSSRDTASVPPHRSTQAPKRRHPSHNRASSASEEKIARRSTSALASSS